MGRAAVYSSSAERDRAYKLRKRIAALDDNECAGILIEMYAEQGKDFYNSLDLPWLSFLDFFERTGETDELAIINRIVKGELPYVELDRSRFNDPRIRICSRLKKKTREAQPRWQTMSDKSPEEFQKYLDGLTTSELADFVQNDLKAIDRQIQDYHDRRRGKEQLLTEGDFNQLRELLFAQDRDNRVLEEIKQLEVRESEAAND